MRTTTGYAQRILCTLSCIVLFCTSPIAGQNNSAQNNSALSNSLQSNSVQENAEPALARAAINYQKAFAISQRDVKTEAFRSVAREYRRIIQSHELENADLYTNLGNSALQAQMLGEAILAFRKALDLDPDHAKASRNLKQARSQLPSWVRHSDNSSVVDTFFFFHSSLSLREKNITAILCFLGFALLLALSIRFNKSWARNLSFLPLLAWACFLASSIIESQSNSSQYAVITASEVIARSADSVGSTRRYPQALPAGVECRVLQSRNNWHQVRLADGRDSWLPSSSISFVRER